VPCVTALFSENLTKIDSPVQQLVICHSQLLAKAAQRAPSTPYQIQIKENEMGGAGSTHGYMRNVNKISVGKILREETTRKT